MFRNLLAEPGTRQQPDKHPPWFGRIGGRSIGSIVAHRSVASDLGAAVRSSVAKSSTLDSPPQVTVRNEERIAWRARVDTPQRSDEHHADPLQVGGPVRATSIIANLRVADVEATKNFYTDYLGLSTEEFNMGWVARYASPDTRANVQLVTRDATAPEDSVISVHTDDVEGAYEEAQQLGYEIVHPITTEPWGVRRFFVRAPDGNVINIVNHRD
jgi:catechol 2,3-dioxygenase-like lactoylglutathione lyase family enzyme